MSSKQPSSSTSSLPQSSLSSTTSPDEALFPLVSGTDDSNDKNDDDKTALLISQSISNFLDDCEDHYLEITTTETPPSSSSSSLVTILLSTIPSSSSSSVPPPPVDKFLSTLIDQLQPSFSSSPSSRFTIVQSLSLLYNCLFIISSQNISLSDSFVRLIGQLFLSYCRRSHHPDDVRDVAIQCLIMLLLIPTIVTKKEQDYIICDISKDRLRLALCGAMNYAGDEDDNSESNISTLRRLQRSHIITLLSLPSPPYSRRYVRYILRCLHGETDPRCLLAMLQLLAQGVEKGIADEVFEAVSVYYPVTFTPPPDDVIGISRNDLEEALMKVLWCNEDMRKLTWELFLDRLEGEEGVDIPAERRDALKDMERVALEVVMDDDNIKKRCRRALFLTYREGVVGGQRDIVRLTRRVVALLLETNNGDLSQPAREALGVLDSEKWSDEKGVVLTYLASLVSDDLSCSERIGTAAGEALLSLQGDNLTKEALFAVATFIRPNCQNVTTKWEESVMGMVMEKWDVERVACARLLERWIGVMGKSGDVVEMLISRVVAVLDDDSMEDGSCRKAYAALVGSYWSLPSAAAALEGSILSFNSNNKSSWIDMALTKCCTLSSAACQLVLSTLWKDCLGSSMKLSNDERLMKSCQRLVYIMSHDETIINECWSELLDHSVTDLLTAWIPSKVEENTATRTTTTTTTTTNENDVKEENRGVMDISLSRLELPPNDDERRRIDNLITTRHSLHAPILALLSLSSSTKLSTSTLSLLLPSLPPLSSHDHINISLLLPLLDASRQSQTTPLSLETLEISQSLAMSMIDIILDYNVYPIVTRQAAMRVFEDVVMNGTDDEVRDTIWREGIKVLLENENDDMVTNEGYWDDIMALVAIMGCITSPRGGFSSPIAMTTSNDIISFLLDCVTKEQTSKDLSLRAATTFGCILSHNPSSTVSLPLWKQRLACKALIHLRHNPNTFASDAILSYIACHLPCKAFSMEDWTFMYQRLTKRLVTGGDDEDVRTMVLSCLIKMMSFEDVMVVMNNDDSLITALRHVLIPTTTTTTTHPTTSQSLLALQCLKNLYPHNNKNDNPRRMQDQRWAVLSILDRVVNHKTRIVRLAAVELRNLWGL